MNKLLITIIFFIKFSTITMCQSITIIEESKFQGAIFPKTYKNTTYNWLDEEKRFTPTSEEIKIFETILQKNIKKINKKRWNQTGSCPVIHKNLKKYNRQYLGFIDDSGKKYLLINFLWYKNHQEKIEDEYYNELGDWKKNWQIWYDGCSTFWNVKYYLDSDTLFDLQINGSS